MLKTNVRKYDNFKLYYWHGATLVGKYRLPQLAPTQAIPSKVICFNERKGITKPEEYWVDFFIDDALFENFWNHPEMSFENLKRFAGIITTDYSMLPEMLPAQSLWNCTRNRVMAYYLQQQGFNIIPVASWCVESDFYGALMVCRKTVLSQLPPMDVCQVLMAGVCCCAALKNCKSKKRQRT